MKNLTIICAAACLTLLTATKAPAQIINFYFGGTATTVPYTSEMTFPAITFTQPELNATLSATLTAHSAKLPASATVTADVYLVDAGVATLVTSSSLSLNLSTPSNNVETTSTPGYPLIFFPGPIGPATVDDLRVVVTASDLVNAGVSFSGEAELEDIPEPSSWALMFGGLGMIGVFGLRRIGVRR